MITGLDLETCRFQPGLRTPPVVCAGLADSPTEAYVVPTDELLEEVRARIVAPNVVIGHNLSYDFADLMVWEPELYDLIWQAYEEDRVWDTMHHERLGEITSGKPRGHLGLFNVAGRYGIEMPIEKGADGGGVQTSYGPLLHRPLSEYSDEQILYLRHDAMTPLKVWERQRKRHGNVELASICDLGRRHLWLTLVSNYGFRTDPKKVAFLKERVAARLATLRDIAMSPYWLDDEAHPTPEQLAREAAFTTRPKTKEDRALAKFIDEFRLVKRWDLNPKMKGEYKNKKNTKRIQAIVKEAYDGRPPLTQPARDWKPTAKKPEFVPGISTARATLEESGHPLLESFSEYGEYSSIMNKDVPMLLLGTTYPIHTKFGFANTLRTTASKPNSQNWATEGGIRECVIPREGYVLISADHTGMETACLAQTIVEKLGRRGLADMLNNDESPLLHLAAAIERIDYAEALARYEAEDKVLKNSRNASKVALYGVPGGMGILTLCLYAKNYGFVRERAFTPDFARFLIGVLKETIPDIDAYLRYVKRLPRDGAGRYFVEIPGSKVVRSGATFCSAANTGFQGRGANLEANVGWHLMKACLDASPGNPLRGCRIINFVHDEFIMEAPIGQRTEAAEALVRIMVERAQPYLPDVKIDAKATCMAYWSKDAYSTIDEHGELTIWNGND